VLQLQDQVAAIQHSTTKKAYEDMLSDYDKALDSVAHYNETVLEGIENRIRAQMRLIPLDFNEEALKAAGFSAEQIREAWRVARDKREEDVRVRAQVQLGFYNLAQKRLSDEGMVYAHTLDIINERLQNRIINEAQAAKLRFDAANERSGGRLKDTEKEDEAYLRSLASLNADLAHNNVDIVVYQRSLIKLKEASGSAWAAMGQAVKGYTDQTSTLLADFFNGTSTNWHKMFASMVHDMEVAIIKAMIMKPVMDALAASLTSLTKGGGAGFFATFASYFNGSTPSTPSTGNYSNVGSGLNTSGAGGFTGKLPSVGPYSGASAAFSVAGMPTSQAKAAQPRGTGDVYLSVTVATNGSAQTQERGDNDQGIAVARSLAAKMREVIIDEQRPNGIIYDFVHGR
jgi:hypothetical protein